MAASDFHFYSMMFSDLNAALGSYISVTATSVSAAIAPVATTLVTIYVMLWGWSMLRGVIQEPVTDGVGRVVRLALIVAVALNVGYYNSFLSEMLWNSPDALASYVGGGDGSTNAAFLDRLMSQMFDFGRAYYQKAQADATLGIPDLGPLGMAFLLWGSGIVVTAFGGFLLALCKIALAVLLGVGMLFVLMTIFEPTKRFFDVWIGQALNYVFLVMLSSATMKLILAILQHYLTDASGAVLADPSLNQAIPAVVFSLIGFLTLMQMPSIASALGGGVAIGTLGAVGWAYAKARGGATSAKNVVTGRTLSDMRSFRRHKAMNARWAANNPSIPMRAAGAPMAVYRRITGGGRNRVARAG
jgi:type IV secretion system protein VirB6